MEDALSLGIFSIVVGAMLFSIFLIRKHCDKKSYIPRKFTAYALIACTCVYAVFAMIWYLLATVGENDPLGARFFLVALVGFWIVALIPLYLILRLTARK